jgi:mannose-6-phosphate isomerase-like protein (cupin superfamily)
MKTARLHETYVRSGEGSNLWFLGQLVTFKIHGQSSAVGVFQLITPPNCGTPPHRHPVQDETHYVLHGQYAFRCANHSLQVGPGALVHVPAGMAHGFRNIGGEPGELLCIATPAGPLERFFEAVGEPITDPAVSPPSPLEIKRLRSIAEQVGGLEFVDQAPSEELD